RNEAFTSPPPSTSRLVTFSAPSFLTSHGRPIWQGVQSSARRERGAAFDNDAHGVTRPTFVTGATMTFTRLVNAFTRDLGARLLTTTVVSAACSSVMILASSGVRAIESRMIRRNL